MTNPLPIETELKLLCELVIDKLCVCGQGYTKPFLIAELTALYYRWRVAGGYGGVELEVV